MIGRVGLSVLVAATLAVPERVGAQGGQVLVLDVAKGRFEATDIPPPGDGDHATPNAFQLQ